MQSYNKAPQVVLPGDGGEFPLKLDFIKIILQKKLNNCFFRFSDHDEYPDHRQKLIRVLSYKFLRQFPKINYLLKLFSDFATVVRTAPFILIYSISICTLTVSRRSYGNLLI